MIKILCLFYDIKIIIIIIILLSRIIIKNYIKDDYLDFINFHPFYLSNKMPILSYDKTKYNILKEGRKFLDRCFNSVYSLEYNYINKPKISVIVPMFNCEKTIIPTLRSIQFQNKSKIEIILINDFSSDNTSKIIKEIMQKDHRIKIINNQKNMGTLYSRCIGALIAKGKYIFSLDNDDLYFNEDIFDFIYKKGKNEKLDIIGFLTIDTSNYTVEIERMKEIYTYQYPDELYIEQPELSSWMINFNQNFLVHNNMIWDKCIKSSVYKQSVNYFGINRYSKFLSWSEDTCMNFVIFNIAKNFKYCHKYGIFHFRSNSTASLRQSNNSKVFGEIFFLDIIFDFSKNNSKSKNFVFGQALYIKNRYGINKFNNDSNSYYLKNVLDKIINSNYIYKQNKRKLKKYFSDYFNRKFSN